MCSVFTGGSNVRVLPTEMSDPDSAPLYSNVTIRSERSWRELERHAPEAACDRDVEDVVASE